MKKFSILLSICLLMAGLMTSCESEEDFDEALLYGRWNEGVEWIRFDEDGNGRSWNSDESNEEDNANPFTWTLNGSTLRIIEYDGQGSAQTVVPYDYTLITLTATELVYEDRYETYSYSKAN